MNDAERYIAESHKALKIALEMGHSNPGALRELLIGTTSRITYAPVIEYFRGHLTDRHLLRDLIAIALEGEDNGDAPWAAANVITEFPEICCAKSSPSLFS